MVIYSQAYQDHPACRAYDEEYEAIMRAWDEAAPEPGNVYAADINRERDARAIEARIIANDKRTIALALDGLVIAIAYYHGGYYVDLAPIYADGSGPKTPARHA